MRRNTLSSEHYMDTRSIWGIEIRDNIWTLLTVSCIANLALIVQLMTARNSRYLDRILKR